MVPKGLRVLAATALLTLSSLPAASQDNHLTPLAWKGLNWNVSAREPLGLVTPGRILSSADNVEITPEDGLTLRIRQGERGPTGARITTQDAWGFGTYTWTLEGPLDALEPPVVFDLFTGALNLAPGSGGPNESHIRFTLWSSEVPGDNVEFTVFPPADLGDPDPAPSYEGGMVLDLKGSLRATVVFDWAPERVSFRVSDAKGRLLRHQVYVPETSWAGIPQAAGYAGMQLWSFGLLPAQDWEILVRDFRFQPRS